MHNIYTKVFFVTRVNMPLSDATITKLRNPFQYYIWNIALAISSLTSTDKEWTREWKHLERVPCYPDGVRTRYLRFPPGPCLSVRLLGSLQLRPSCLCTCASSREGFCMWRQTCLDRLKWHRNRGQWWCCRVDPGERPTSDLPEPV